MYIISAAVFVLFFFTKNESLHLLCNPLLSLVWHLFFFSFSCSHIPFRTSWFPGAPGRQPGGHEEQERGESWSHPPGHEALPVPAQLLRAGDHPGRLHPGCRSGPGAFLIFLFCFVLFFKDRLLLFRTDVNRFLKVRFFRFL